MKKVARRALVGTLALGAGGHATPAQSRSPQRFPLRTASVVSALRADGLEVEATRLRMSTPVSSAVESPVLEMLGAERLPSGEMRLRLRCRAAGECLPFSVTLSRGDVASAVLREADAPGRSSDRQVSVEAQLAKLAMPAAVPVATAAVQAAPPAAALLEAPAAPASVHVGAKLTLLMEEGHMHIHLPVLALDSATTGNALRVCTPDHKQTFRAVVVDATTVRGGVE